jgi:hypothetical protein
LKYDRGCNFACFFVRISSKITSGIRDKLQIAPYQEAKAALIREAFPKAEDNFSYGLSSLKILGVFESVRKWLVVGWMNAITHHKIQTEEAAYGKKRFF